MKISKDRVLRILSDVTNYASMNLCLHEETHRGGLIWEVCDLCGMKWADDEGGMPDDARCVPSAILAAQDLIMEIKGGQ